MSKAYFIHRQGKWKYKSMSIFGLICFLITIKNIWKWQKFDTYRAKQSNQFQYIPIFIIYIHVKTRTPQKGLKIIRLRSSVPVWLFSAWLQSCWYKPIVFWTVYYHNEIEFMTFAEASQWWMTRQISFSHRRIRKMWLEFTRFVRFASW